MPARRLPLPADRPDPRHWKHCDTGAVERPLDRPLREGKRVGRQPGRRPYAGHESPRSVLPEIPLADTDRKASGPIPERPGAQAGGQASNLTAARRLDLCSPADRGLDTTIREPRMMRYEAVPVRTTAQPSTKPVMTAILSPRPKRMRTADPGAPFAKARRLPRSEKKGRQRGQTRPGCLVAGALGLVPPSHGTIDPIFRQTHFVPATPSFRIAFSPTLPNRHNTGGRRDPAGDFADRGLSRIQAPSSACRSPRRLHVSAAEAAADRTGD
jgi:hypothetical protein